MTSRLSTFCRRFVDLIQKRAQIHTMPAKPVKAECNRKIQIFSCRGAGEPAYLVDRCHPRRNPGSNGNLHWEFFDNISVAFESGEAGPVPRYPGVGAFFKNFGKISLIAESALFRNCQNRQICRSQKAFCVFNARDAAGQSACAVELVFGGSCSCKGAGACRGAGEFCVFNAHTLQIVAKG